MDQSMISQSRCVFFKADHVAYDVLSLLVGHDQFKTVLTEKFVKNVRGVVLPFWFIFIFAFPKKGVEAGGSKLISFAPHNPALNLVKRLANVIFEMLGATIQDLLFVVKPTITKQKLRTVFVWFDFVGLSMDNSSIFNPFLWLSLGLT